MIQAKCTDSILNLVNLEILRIGAEIQPKVNQENIHKSRITVMKWFKDNRCATGDSSGTLKIWNEKGEFLLNLIYL